MEILSEVCTPRIRNLTMRGASNCRQRCMMAGAALGTQLLVTVTAAAAAIGTVRHTPSTVRMETSSIDRSAAIVSLQYRGRPIGLFG